MRKNAPDKNTLKEVGEIFEKYRLLVGEDNIHLSYEKFAEHINSALVMMDESVTRMTICNWCNREHLPRNWVVYCLINSHGWMRDLGYELRDAMGLKFDE